MIQKELLNIRIGKIVVIYICTTYLLYYFLLDGGGVKNTKEILTVIFLTFATFSFFLGCRSVTIYKKTGDFIPKRNISVSVLVLLTSVLSLDCIFFLRDLVNMGFAQLSLSMGDNYASYLSEAGGGHSFWGQLFVLLAPVRVFVISYSIFLFDKLTGVEKMLTIFLILVLAMSSIAQGQNVGIGNVLIYVIVPLFIRYYIKGKTQKLFRYLIIILLAFVAFFILNQLLRAEALGYDLADAIEGENSTLVRIFGPRIGSGLHSFIGYFSHAYLGLNYCLQLPFEWTYGYGGSRALDQYLVQYLDFPSMFDHTYPMRVLQVFGYDCQQKWPTAFAWWASDMSFPGVVVWMYFLGRLVCSVFRDAYYYRNFYAIAFLCELAIMIVFLPMNNQAFQGRASLFITVGLFLLWAFKRREYNMKIKRLGVV